MPGQIKDETNISDYRIPVAKSNRVKDSILKVYEQTVNYDDFTDGGATVGTLDLSDSIPIGAYFVRSFVVNVTGFAGDTSAALTIGDGTDADRYNTGAIDVFTTVDVLDCGNPAGTVYHATAKTPKLTITTAADFTSVTAGQLTVKLFYYDPS